MRATLLALLVTCTLAQAATDPRLTTVRSLNEGSGFMPPGDRATWMRRAADLREQVLIAAGLWPMPEKCPLKAVIHGRIDRGDYTVEKVYFQSYPGFYVTGNLYRPTKKAGPMPGVLCPHGHWKDGRFNETPEKDLARQIQGGFERDTDAARYVLQARCANLAKLGCVVFHYDMVGYADADAERFVHRNTFRGVEYELNSLNVFGLQTWNSIRSLDFLASLPEVDAHRIACTGASGGGTQTFVLMAIEDRLRCAAPVCMISAGKHQGGCVCENASLLRVFTDNVEIAACFAPRPFIHPTATGDWTAKFLEEGFPETKAVYRLFGAEGNVEAVRYEAGHNHNLRSREAVYTFFNRHLGLGHASPVVEQKFTPVAPKELSVFDATHPRPADAVDAAGLKKQLTEAAAKRLQAIRPKEAASLEQWRRVMGAAVRHMMATDWPAEAVTVQELGEEKRGDWRVKKVLLSRKGEAAQISAVMLNPGNGCVSLVAHPAGKSGLFGADGKPSELVAGLLAKGHSVVGVDVLLTGELLPAAMPTTKPVEFRAGYNRTILANRVHDLLTAMAWAKPQGKDFNVIGLEKAGPWCLLARSLAGENVKRLVADANGFDFDRVSSEEDENFLPGALRFGGLWAMASLGAPGETMVFNAGAPAKVRWMAGAYEAAGARERLRVEAAADLKGIVEWVGR